MSNAFKPVPSLRDEPWLTGSLAAFKADRLGLVVRVAQECGEIGQFRIGPVTMYFVSGANLLHQILVQENARFSPKPFMKNFFPVLGRTTLPGTDGDYHLRLRRIMAPAFQPRRIVGYCEHMVALADELQRGVEDGAELEVVHLMHHLTLKILAKSVFHMDFNEDERFFDCINAVSEYVGRSVANPLLPPLWVPTPYNKKIRELIAYLRGRAKAMLEEGRRRGTDRGDVLSMLLVAKDTDGTGLTEEELLDQILTLYIAGHETTANSLSFCLMLLAQHPDVQARLHAELDRVLGGRPPTFQDVARLPYTTQVVKEVLRLYPPAAFFARAPLEDVVVDGYMFRKGQICLISPYASHRNSQFFPDPERFDPERFTPENEKKLPRDTYFPYGDGPHVCIGQHFAQLEIQLVLAQLMQNLSISLVPDQQIRLMAMATLTSSSIRIKAVRRKAAIALAS